MYELNTRTSAVVLLPVEILLTVAGTPVFELLRGQISDFQIKPVQWTRDASTSVSIFENKQTKKKNLSRGSSPWIWIYMGVMFKLGLISAASFIKTRYSHAAIAKTRTFNQSRAGPGTSWFPHLDPRWLDDSGPVFSSGIHKEIRHLLNCFFF